MWKKNARKIRKRKEYNFFEAMKIFLVSDLYKQLFDYETELYKEGPDYLLDYYIKDCKK